MPHKVNPIDFENAEGNLGMANAIFQISVQQTSYFSFTKRFNRQYRIKKYQAFLFAHTIIAFASLDKGIGKLLINQENIAADLEKNWVVVAEAIQTILRREGYPNPYEALKDLTRTNTVINAESIASFIDTLNINDTIKDELKAITPNNYTGI